MEHHAWMQRMEEASQKQTAYARGQFIMAAVCALCCLIILIAVLALVPQVREALAVIPQIEEVLVLVPQVQEVLGYAETTLANLEQISEELVEADLAGTVKQLDKLATTSEESIRQTLEKLQQLDFEVLNKAIEDLASALASID